jgi:hypothetical protein
MACWWPVLVTCWDGTAVLGAGRAVALNPWRPPLVLGSAPAFGAALFGDSLRDVLDPKLRATLTATGCARNEWGLFDSRLQDVRDLSWVSGIKHKGYPTDRNFRKWIGHVRSCLTRQVQLPTIQEPKFWWQELPKMIRKQNGADRTEPRCDATLLGPAPPYDVRSPIELLEHAFPRA